MGAGLPDMAGHLLACRAGCFCTVYRFYPRPQASVELNESFDSREYFRFADYQSRRLARAEQANEPRGSALPFAGYNNIVSCAVIVTAP